MGAFYERVVRPVLFLQDPEKAHDFGVGALGVLGHLRPLCGFLQWWNQLPASFVPIELFGLRFPNAVGLAAGMDKNGRCWPAAPSLGFGHVEIGTITGQRQPGNDRPRVFRYPRHLAIINRMGFNNDGAEAVAARLKAMRRNRRFPVPLGINLGKTKLVPLERAAEDYLFSFQQLAPYADYVAINVSSPNTPDLRRLQAAEHLGPLLRALHEANQGRARKLGVKAVPILLKIAPDLSFREIDEVLAISQAQGVAGLIATNTTVGRPPALAAELGEAGGLSGAPLHRRSVEVVNYIHRATAGRLPIIGCGGIHDVRTAGAMLDAGASLLQIYTGFVYRGPFFPKQLAAALAPRQTGWVR